ncbi:hypothetical protein K439DRAFT_1619862 [Ramaria rubella]|nr:hypothetical protein K439DRAFT_1619862 [Ramaria rubella]
MSSEYPLSDEERSPSPAATIFSTPSKTSNATQGSVVSPSRFSPSVPIAEIDEVASLRLEIFRPCRDRIRAAEMMLTWGRNREQIWLWPSHQDGRLFADYELPTAFERYYKHDYHIWVVREDAFQVCLTDPLTDHPDMPSQICQERPANDRTPGLTDFNSYGIL